MKSILFALTVALLAGCSSHYTPIIINPAELTPTAQWPDSPTVRFAVEDQRPAQYLAKIQGSGEQVTLVSASNNLSSVVQQRLTSAYLAQGLVINEQAPAAVTVEIHTALVQVSKPGHFDYSLDSHVKMTLRVDQSGRRFAKQFRGSRTTLAPIKPDTAALESELNALLAKVLGEMANDREVGEFITSTTAQ